MAYKYKFQSIINTLPIRKVDRLDNAGQRSVIDICCFGDSVIVMKLK